jgi:hypothetical protein
MTTIHIKNMKRGVVYRVVASEWPLFRIGDLLSVSEFTIKYTKDDEGNKVFDTNKSKFVVKNNTTGKIVEDISDSVYLTEDLDA